MDGRERQCLLAALRSPHGSAPLKQFCASESQTIHISSWPNRAGKVEMKPSNMSVIQSAKWEILGREFL